MFDVSFMEMALIGVIALVVIGPERLPGVARTVGQWIGSARRFVSSVQTDINLEVNKADELKRLLEEQTKIQSLHDILEQTPTEPDDRKPVPRAVPSKQSSSVSEPQETLPEQKQAHTVTAINNDAPTADNNNTVAGSPSNNRHG